MPDVRFTDTVTQLSVNNEITTAIFIPRIKVYLKPTIICCNSLRLDAGFHSENGDVYGRKTASEWPPLATFQTKK